MELHRSLVDYVPLGKDGLQLREAAMLWMANVCFHLDRLV